eukprot:3660970-Prorocentrum_lima.AAC.1
MTRVPPAWHFPQVPLLKARLVFGYLGAELNHQTSLSPPRHRRLLWSLLPPFAQPHQGRQGQQPDAIERVEANILM